MKGLSDKNYSRGAIKLLRDSLWLVIFSDISSDVYNKFIYQVETVNTKN